MNFSKSITVMLAATLVLAASCLRDEVPEGTGDGIVFSADGTRAAESRGVVATQASLRKIGVFGYSHVGAFASSASPDYFFNHPVAKPSGATGWSYDGVRRYWPQTGSMLSFFAYAPYQDVQDWFVLAPASETATGAPTIDYTVPTALYEQLDLLWDNALNQTVGADNGTPRPAAEQGKVTFTMNHALTRVNFSVRLDAAEQGRPFVVEFTELTVRNVIGDGRLDMSKSLNDSGLWTTTRPADDGDLASYTMTPGGHGGLNYLTFDTRTEIAANPAERAPVWKGAPLFRTGADAQYLLLIPQPLADTNDTAPAQVVLKYQMTNLYTGEMQQGEETLSLHRAVDMEEWEPGMSVSYQITLKLLKGAEIDFTVETLAPWTSGGGEIGGNVG